MKVLGICGLPGSGKSTVIDAVKDLGIVITMGDVIRKEAKLRNINLTSDNLGRLAKELREKGGSEIVAKKCVEMISEFRTEIIIIDGVRSLEEIDVFRRLWKFPLIAIELNDEKRFERLTERGRSDDPTNLKDLRERDNREIGFGLKKVIKKANYKIINDSTIEELKKKSRELVLNLIQSY